LEIMMKLLIALQDCDTRIRYIQEKMEEGPITIQMLSEGLNDILKQLEEEKDQLDTYRRERRDAEREVEDLEGRIVKSNIKLSNIKSNKEYRAALKEISDLKMEKSILEDKVLEIMEEMERLEQRCVANETKGAELKDKIEKDRAEILKQMKGLDQDLRIVEKERDSFCKSIDADLLRRYNQLMENKGNFAISPVIKGVCQSCHMGIPPQKFNELIRGDELMTCPNCMRIIYWGENERFQNKGTNKD